MIDDLYQSTSLVRFLVKVVNGYMSTFAMLISHYGEFYNIHSRIRVEVHTSISIIIHFLY